MHHMGVKPWLLVFRRGALFNGMMKITQCPRLSAGGGCAKGQDNPYILLGPYLRQPLRAVRADFLGARGEADTGSGHTDTVYKRFCYYDGQNTDPVQILDGDGRRQSEA